jgi:hypothetical protein
VVFCVTKKPTKMIEPDDKGRVPIPAEIRRRILVEAGHRCAIPTCRYIDVDVHHIVPWASSRAHEYDNLIALCPNCHRRADRGEIDRKSLRLYKLNIRFVHDKYSQLEMDVLFELARTGYPMLWWHFNLILLKRIHDSGFIEISYSETTGSPHDPPSVIPDFLHITEKGRTFINELGTSELYEPLF